MKIRIWDRRFMALGYCTAKVDILSTQSDRSVKVF